MESDQLYSMPRIGDSAPSFRAITTQGKINFPEDYTGKWKILFSHPSDFTPVCTSEFVTFGSMAKEFEALNCQLVGVSVDGLQSHIAWLRTIKEKIGWKGFKDLDITFPLVADLSMHVAKLYGMIQPNVSNTVAVRAVFFIDPKDTIQAIIYYPLFLGRNFDEIKRVLIALQTHEAMQISLPADWRPGDEVIAAAPLSMDAAQERMEHPDPELYCYDWFFCTKPLPKEEIEKQLGVDAL